MIPRRSVLMGAVDITSFLSRSVQSLEIGELLMSPQFNLGDTLPAIQIMTRKMDSGMALVNFDKEKTRKEDICRMEISLDRARSVMDLLLGHLVLWLEGAPLHSTVYSCVYLHALNDIPNYELRLFCESLLFFISEAILSIREARVGYGEDIILETAGPVHVNIPKFYEESVLSLEDLLSSQEEGQEEDLTQTQDCDTFGNEQIRLRLTLMYLLCGFMIALKDTSQGNTSGLLDIIERLNKCLSKLEETAIDNDQETNIYTLKDFDLSLNCEYSSQIPLFDLKMPSLGSALQFLTKFLDKIKSIFHIRETSTMTQLLPTIRYFGQESSTWNILTSSISHKLLLQNQILGRFDRVEAMILLLGPAGAYTNHVLKNEGTAHLAKPLIQDLPKLYEFTLCIFLMNKGRQHRDLNSYIQEWELFQQLIEPIDHKIHEQIFTDQAHCVYPLSLMVYKIKLELLSIKYELGFELELYVPSEYAMIFWYLGFIYQTRRDHLLRIQNTTRDLWPSSSELKHVENEDADTSGEIEFLTAVSSYYRGMLKVCCLLRRAGYLCPNFGPLYDEETHYRHRFQAFYSLQSPCLLTWKEFQRTIESVIPFKKLWEDAVLNLTEAETHLKNWNHGTLEKGRLSHHENTSNSGKSMYRQLIDAVAQNKEVLSQVDFSSLSTDKAPLIKEQFDPVRQRSLFTIEKNSAFPILVANGNLPLKAPEDETLRQT